MKRPQSEPKSVWGQTARETISSIRRPAQAELAIIIAAAALLMPMPGIRGIMNFFFCPDAMIHHFRRPG
jgi:hypothetical protein